MTESLSDIDLTFTDDVDLKRIIVIGNGPVGIHFCNELLRYSTNYEIIIFGEEAYSPYNRVALSQFLYGDQTLKELELKLVDSAKLKTQWHTRITEINKESKQVITQYGECFNYDQLILATGSRAHIPNLPGVHLRGVYTFRNLKDAEALLSRQVKSRHTVILGGGLLGIETARAMKRHSTEVTLIHHSSWLMNRQLDEGSATRLLEKLREEDIAVRLSTSVMAVDGSDQMTSIILRNGEVIKCDTLILSTGIRPNIDLAKQVGIAFGQGIKINNELETSIKDIFAIGECAEINGQVFGLVAPGLAQASLLAKRLARTSTAHYQQQALASKLKVLALPVLSLGEIGLQHEGPESRLIHYARKDKYRVLRFERGRFKGASAIGNWPDHDRLKDTIEQDKNLNLLQLIRFKLFGSIWGETQAIQDHHIICNCRQITAGELRLCAQQSKPFSCTGAGTVCGSCKPLLAEFTDNNEALEPASKDKALIYACIASLFALVAMIAFQFTQPWMPPESYNPNSLSTWWTDTEKRQISGFFLLGFTVLSLLVSASKRISSFKWLTFSNWRFVHTLLITLVLFGLFFHTGVSNFQGINAWLIFCFWGAAVAGVVSTLITKLAQTRPSMSLNNAKKSTVFLHIVSVWPLPVLLGFHILSVYWF